MSNNGLYAKPKRRKPLQKSAKSSPVGVKSNPSKRHRDRLNGELESLASLLPFPQDVVSKLDKLTVLRLCVSYLRAKSFFSVVFGSSDARGPSLQGEELLEAELLLKVLNGFLLVVSADGMIFYVSPSIKDYLGFHQSDVIHQSAYELIHTEDRSEFRKQLHWAFKPPPSPQGSPGDSCKTRPLNHEPACNPENLPPENSAFLKRNFVCRLRSFLDNSSGFLAMNVQGRLKVLHGQKRRSPDGCLVLPQLALFALATPLQPPSIVEIRTRNFLFRTKHKLDFTPTACDARGKLVLGYTEAELCDRGTGYQFIHAADMLYCAENHIRMMKTGDSGMTVFRLLSKQSRWLWVQANARLIYKNGKPDYIIASQKVLTDEEGEDNLRKRNLRLPFHFATGEALLYDSGFLRSLSDAGLGGGVPSGQGSLDPDSLLGAMLKQDDSIYVCLPGQEQISLQSGELPNTAGDAGSIFHSDWNQNHLIFPESIVTEPDSRSEEDKNGDLWTLMSSLGVCSEDLELLQQDGTFFREDTPGNGDIADVADEILAYVGESLTIQSDCVLAGDSGMAACLTQCQKPHSLLCQSRQEQPPDPPRCPPAPDRQDVSLETWTRGRAAEQQNPHVCKQPQLLMHRDDLLADCPHQRPHHRLSHVQVSEDPPSSVAMDAMNGHPSSFKLDQPHLQMLPPPLYGCFIVEGPPPELHDQDGPVSDPDGLFSARLPQFPVVLEDHFPALDLEELLGIPELGGVGGEACVTVNHPPVSQCVSVAELPGLGESPVPPQAHFQSGTGDMDAFSQDSCTLSSFHQQGGPLHQLPRMSALYPDLPLGGFARSSRPWLG
ncbi:aryl hydrocarbon receptor 1a isoform X1 [Paramormyrops kingsleyae]|uniref:aryl hydrocarbon receptor 1a isoform X1 n=1 Tax=Paramormyrops kingsleyae TaxID=1676925 RepID=UPI003B972E14